MSELSTTDIKTWVRNFAQESGLRCEIDLTLEDLIRLFDSRVQWRLSRLRGTILKDYPIGSEWLDQAIAGKTLSLNDNIRLEFKNYLLERVLDTDAVIILTGSNGKRLKISLQSHWSEPSPTQVQLSQNFPDVRGLLGITKHLILRLSTDSDQLPTHQRLINEIDTFSAEAENTKILDLTDIEPWDVYKWGKVRDTDPSSMWHRYSEGIVAHAANLVALEAAKRAFRDNYTHEEVTRMLTQDPSYLEFLRRDGGNPHFADIHARAISLNAEITVAQEPPEDTDLRSQAKQIF